LTFESPKETMMVRLPAAAAAEFIGTFAFCFIGILATQHAALGGGLLLVALAHGLAYSVTVTAAMPTSGGHLNPAVTLGFLLTGKIKILGALVYIVFQLLGATVAALAVYALLGADEQSAAIIRRGTPSFVASEIPIATALLAEIIASAILVFAIWGSAADPRARNVGGFAIGLAVSANILAIGPITGGAMNPARVFGPTLVASLAPGNSLWPQHWVYWVGPIVGAGIMAIFYHLQLWPRDPQRKIDPDAMQVPPSQRP
jgi:aquaporin Z